MFAPSAVILGVAPTLYVLRKPILGTFGVILLMRMAMKSRASLKVLALSFSSGVLMNPQLVVLLLSNIALNLAPFCRWTLRDKSA